jgi:hypothetical protein
MSTQIGTVKLVGKMGGISFYLSEGKYLARKAGGPSREKILHHPNFERTRDNIREFSGCAKAARHFREACYYSRDCFDSRFTSRLTQLFKEIASRHDSPPGKRPINISEHKALLRNLQFNKNVSLFSALKAAFTLLSPDEKSMDVTFEGLVPAQHIHAPADATHLRLIVMMADLSDLYFDERNNQYNTIDKGTGNGASAFIEGDYIQIDHESPLNINLSCSLKTPMPHHVTRIRCIGVKFYKNSNAQMHLLPRKNAMMIVTLSNLGSVDCVTC